MMISEIAEQTNVSKSTLRYYEKIGLIPSVPRIGNGVHFSGVFFLERKYKKSGATDTVDDWL